MYTEMAVSVFATTEKLKMKNALAVVCIFTANKRNWKSEIKIKV